MTSTTATSGGGASAFRSSDDTTHGEVLTRAAASAGASIDRCVMPGGEDARGNVAKATAMEMVIHPTPVLQGFSVFHHQDV